MSNELRCPEPDCNALLKGNVRATRTISYWLMEDGSWQESDGSDETTFECGTCDTTLPFDYEQLGATEYTDGTPVEVEP